MKKKENKTEFVRDAESENIYKIEDGYNRV